MQNQFENPTHSTSVGILQIFNKKIRLPIEDGFHTIRLTLFLPRKQSDKWLLTGKYYSFGCLIFHCPNLGTIRSVHLQS